MVFLQDKLKSLVQDWRVLSLHQKQVGCTIITYPVFLQFQSGAALSPETMNELAYYHFLFSRLEVSVF